MQKSLKIFAIVCKVIAVIEWLGIAWIGVPWDISELRGTSHSAYRDSGDMGTPAWYHRIYWEIFVICALVLIAVIPNRWLVSSRFAFWISLLITLIPGIEVSTSFPGVISGTVLILLSSFLPISLICSF